MEMSPNDIVEVMPQPWRYMPHTFAAVLSEGKWKPFDYLTMISHVVVAALALGDARITISVPPRHGKSWFLSQWLPTWFLCNWPDERIVLASYEATFASSWGRKVRDLVKLHGPQFNTGVSETTGAASAWETIQGGGMVTAGAGGPITGRGMNLGLIDDPHKNWAEAMSPLICSRIHDWYDSTFYTRLEPGGSIIILHTRWGENDLIGYIMREKTNENWIHIRIPAIAEENDMMGRPVGQALCPERYDIRKLNNIKKAVGARVWAGLYQQRPAAAEGNIWKREYIRYWKGGIPPIVNFVLQSWDTGYKKTGESAYSVCQTWGVGPLGAILLWQWREMVEFPELQRQVVTQYNKFKPNAILIEDRASGQSLIQHFQRSSNYPIIPIQADNSTGGKVIRAIAASPMFESGRVWVPEESVDFPWVGEMVNNWATFPNGVYADETDAASQSLSYIASMAAMGNVASSATRRAPGILAGFNGFGGDMKTRYGGMISYL
ncbi:MAG: hypothetical protein CSYNP_01595 [Syntrophus sp. SKADARSKE-3]|nr:hypothetical protein [Syntrophus sp. SKADARSKE-3]